MIIHIDNIKNSSVFLRVDLNVPIKKTDDGKMQISDITRIEKIIPTIEKLLKNGNKIILASHFGRPKNLLEKEKFSLRPIFLYLQNIFLKTKISFIENFSDLPEKLENLNELEVFFLENLRFHDGEEKNSNDFREKLSNLAKFYINDAFSCSHRAHASIMMAENYDKSHKALGPLFESEIQNINQFYKNDSFIGEKKIAIIGGSKISTKISLIKALQEKFDYIFIGGAMANMLLLYKNFEIGLSLVEDLTDELRCYLDEIFNHKKCKVILPSDVVCISQDIENIETIKTKSIQDVQKTDIILDIGQKTISDLKSSISSCMGLIWNGPLGLFENQNFAAGTKEIAEYIANQTNSGALKSLVGGGDTISAINLFKIDHKSFSHVCTAGGAFLEYIENDLNLIGLDALISDLIGLDALISDQKNF